MTSCRNDESLPITQRTLAAFLLRTCEMFLWFTAVKKKWKTLTTENIHAFCSVDLNVPRGQHKAPQLLSTHTQKKGKRKANSTTKQQTIKEGKPFKGNNSKGLNKMLGRCVTGQGSNDDVSNFPEVNVNSTCLNLFIVGFLTLNPCSI